jgi:hypothetical protein
MRYLSIILLLTIISCKQTKENAPEPVYADIKTYFKSEADRLSKKKSLVFKTIRQNQTSESKNKVPIDWQNELSLFTESDINKSAWRNSYNVIQTNNQMSYNAKDANLRTREIRIDKDLNGNFKQIYIKNITKNNLYESIEVLIYIQDSIYRIEKMQDVFLLGKNNLYIEGKTINN